MTYRFSKSKKKNEFRRSLYNIKKQKNLSTAEIKETEKNLLELEKSLSSLKRYYDYDNTIYKEISDIVNLFNEVALNEIDEDYYKPTKTKSAFNGNYTEYEKKGDKHKNLSPEEYLNIVRPYLSGMMNDHKTIGKWKIQLTMQINLFHIKVLKKLLLCYQKP